MNPTSNAVNGSFCPDGLIMRYNEPDDNQNDEEWFRFVAAVAHERCHWWQYAGTSIGLMFQFIADVQKDRIRSYVEENNRLTPEHFPFVQAHEKSTPMFEWRVLDMLRNDVFGGSTFFAQYPLDQSLRSYIFGAEQVVEKWLTPDLRELNRVTADTKIDTSPLHAEGLTGVTFGANQLMEFLARANEVHLLGHSVGLTDTDAINGYFTEKYSGPMDMYKAAVGRNFVTAEDWIVLMTVADWALNPPLPPLFHPDHLERWEFLHPGARFIMALQNVRDVVDGDKSKFRTAEERGEKIEKINQRFVNSGYLDAKMSNAVGLSLDDPFDDVDLSAQVDDSRWRHILNCYSEFAILRFSDPSRPIFPALFRVENPKEYLEWTKTVDPPLAQIGDGPIGCSAKTIDCQPAFLVGAVWYVFSRAAAHLDYAGVVAALQPFARDDYNTEYLRIALKNFPLDDEFIEKLVRDVIALK